MSQLSSDLKKSRKAAYATGTSKNHRTQWRTYLYFTLHFNLVFLPASLHTVCLYCQFLSWSMTPPSVRNYLSGVKLLHLMLGFEFPHLSSHELKLTLCGIDRLAQHRPHRAPLIIPTLLRTLVASGVDFDPVDITFLCAFFLFLAFLILFLSPSLPRESRSTCRGDVVPTHYGLCVQFTWSKAIQFGERVLELPLVHIPDSPICPVCLFYLMCEIIPAPQSAPLFVIPSCSGRLRPVLKSQFVSVLHDRLQSAGRSGRGHSFR